MSGKKCQWILLTMLFVSVLSLAIDLRPVQAGGTIYIRADGSVDPPSANITSVDSITYTFTNNNYDELVIERNNIVVDGNGFTLQGSGVENSRGIYLGYRNNVTIKNTRIEGFWCGIHIDYSSSINITGNDVMSIGRYGILLWQSTGNSITQNNVTNHAPEQIHNCGIYLGSCYNGNNNISANNITRSNWGGIYVDGATNNRFSENIFVSCGIALGYQPYDNVAEGNLVNDKPLVYLEDAADLVVEDAGQVILVNCSGIIVRNLNLSDTSVGVELWDSTDSTVTNNTMSGNSMTGVTLWSSSGNTISENNVVDGIYYGIFLWYSSSNKVCHNNIINNSAYQAIEGPSGYGNLWDDGYPSGGNYWSNYTDVDLYGGGLQNEPGSDGIWDHPYVISADNTDHYPLTKRLDALHDLGVVYANTSKTDCLPVPTVGLGYDLNMTACVRNYAVSVETFNLTVCTNSSVIWTATDISVEGRHSTELSMACNTDGLSYGNYTLSVCAGPVIGETDTTDNTRYCWIIVTIPGDSNGDFIVDIYDAILLANAYNSRSEDPKWNPNADINGDGIVDIYDAIILANHYNQHFP